VDAEVFQANGWAERGAALIILEKIPGRRSVTVTVGGDKGLTLSGLQPSAARPGQSLHGLLCQYSVEMGSEMRSSLRFRNLTAPALLFPLESCCRRPLPAVYYFVLLRNPNSGEKAIAAAQRGSSARMRPDKK
jgi:hypothetical protein